MNAGDQISKELRSALTYILVIGLLFWTPLVYLLSDVPTPLHLFQSLGDAGLALMFFTGAMIASATAVGGGIVFNPTLQLIFGVGGYSALTLAILVQCAGMTSGTYGWFSKGTYTRVDRRHLTAMVAMVIATTILSSLLFLTIRPLAPERLLVVMKILSTCVSFYVSWLVIQEIRKPPEVVRTQKPLRVDRRIWGWLALGTLLNVTTAVGAGQLLFAHLIKYYKAEPKVAVATGTLIQAVSVLTQAVFIAVSMRDDVLIKMVCIGLFFCMVGGRMAPLIITRPLIEPWTKHILAVTAFLMGLTSGSMLLLSFL